MNVKTASLIRRRAENRCEYCLIRQEDEPYLRLHIEHIVARQHGGGDSISNLALSCHHCSQHKGTNLSAIDPISLRIVHIFHPRRQKWKEHFFLLGTAIKGLTPVGRATARLLNVNATRRMELRFALRGRLR